MIILEKKFDNLKGGLWNQRKQTERKFNIRIFLYLDLAYIKNTKINYAMNKLKKLTNVTHLKVLAEIFSAYREINLVRKNDKKIH